VDCICHLDGQGNKCVEKFGGQWPFWKKKHVNISQIDLSEMGHKYFKWIELADDYNKLRALVLELNLHVLLLEIIAF